MGKVGERLMGRVGDRVRVTTAPWEGALGTIEDIDGGYHIVRFDTSEHPDDVHELYPNEFEILPRKMAPPTTNRRAAIEAARKTDA